MYDKPQIIFEMIKTAGLLYELRFQGPNKLMYAMGRYNRAAYKSETDFDGEDDINDSSHSAEEMALAFLEHVYNEGPCPRWLEKIEESDGFKMLYDPTFHS